MYALIIDEIIDVFRPVVAVFEFIYSVITTITQGISDITQILSSIINLILNILKILPYPLYPVLLIFVGLYSTILVYKLIRKG